jgi:hypothetical protein
MAGVPMVATSPMRHDVFPVSPNGEPIQPADVHSYKPPWKTLCDFAIHSDLDRPPDFDLVNEVHCTTRHHFQLGQTNTAAGGGDRHLTTINGLDFRHGGS